MWTSPIPEKKDKLNDFFFFFKINNSRRICMFIIMSHCWGHNKDSSELNQVNSQKKLFLKKLMRVAKWKSTASLPPSAPPLIKCCDVIMSWKRLLFPFLFFFLFFSFPRDIPCMDLENIDVKLTQLTQNRLLLCSPVQLLYILHNNALQFLVVVCSWRFQKIN